MLRDEVDFFIRDYTNCIRSNFRKRKASLEELRLKPLILESKVIQFLKNFQKALRSSLERDAENLEFWLVNGRKVREGYEPKFIQGGHHYRYPFIPEQEVWIENAFSKEAFPISVHEIYERHLMGRHGFNYDHSHRHARALEEEFRIWVGMANYLKG